MIKANKIQEEVRRGLNRVNSGYSKRFSVTDIDGFANEAIDIIYENVAIKFETNTLFRNHLRQLEVKKQKCDCIPIDKYSCKIQYPIDFYMLTRQWALACVDDCKVESVIDLHIIQTSDLNESLKDPNWKPSFAWEEALAEEAGDGLIIYHNCEFEVKEVFIDYLRKIKHIATPSLLLDGCDSCKYITSDGEEIETDRDFEIDSTLIWRKVVQVTILNALLSIGEINDYQAKLNNILTLDRIFVQ